MSLFSRILTYGFGVLLGSLLVYFMLFRNRDRNLAGWLPKERIMAQIKDNPMTVTPKAACIMSCFGIEESELKETISKGNVNLSESEARKQPCPVYLINSEDLNFKVEVCEKASVVIDIVTEKSCDC
jgi:hypothetical protein